jgi:hypothetical protein
MKKTKIFYWIFTALFSAFMIFSSVGDVLMTADTVTFMTMLGYPMYILPFLGVAKILGSIVILLPGFDRVKEWAYAGLAIDLAGATYSMVYVTGVNAGILFMLMPVTFLVLSYVLHHRKKEMSQVAPAF